MLDATAYRMILRKGNQVIDTYDGDDDFTFHLVNLEAGEYTWQIIASYENGSALTSATQLFQVIDGSVKTGARIGDP